MTSSTITAMLSGMLKDLFHTQQKLLEHFYQNLNYVELQNVFEFINECKGALFFTGVGKSGFIAQKVAATIMSTGSKAFFLSPTDALHGDLGMVYETDLVIIFSKSGETEELLSLLPALRNKKAQLIGVVSNPSSRLAASVDHVIHLPCEKELCPFDLAPTTSTEVQLLFGNCLAMALMQNKGFTQEQYAQNHPAGQIGKRLTLKVKDLMLSEKKMPLCSLSSSLEEVMQDFSAKQCGCLVVVDQNKRLKGIFTDGDLRRAIEKLGQGALKQTVSSLMSPSPRSIGQEARAVDAIKLMEQDPKRPITVLPVVQEDEQIVGLVKMHDILAAGL